MKLPILPIFQSFKIALTCALFVSISFSLNAQVGEDEVPESLRQLIEVILEENGGDGDDFAFNDLAEKFSLYAKKPLNLNKASMEDLEDFFLLNDVQISGLIAYRQEYGDLLACLLYTSPSPRDS